MKILCLRVKFVKRKNGLELTIEVDVPPPGGAWYNLEGSRL